MKNYISKRNWFLSIRVIFLISVFNIHFGIAQVSAALNYTAIAAGQSHSLALKSDGSLWVTGDNSVGQLGTGNKVDQGYWINTLNGVTAIEAGTWQSFVLKSDGSLWATGRNNDGQLGVAGTSDRTSWINVLNGVTAIAAGNEHSLALKSDGSLWAVGGNGSGQLGTGDNLNRTSWTNVLNGVTAIAAGNSHSLALKSDGSLWAVGSNSSGQLGVAGTSDRTSWSNVLNGVTAIAAGGNHSLALKSDGTLWAVGYSIYGQLGNGLNGVTAIAAGSLHSLALKSDGTLWATGRNNAGQLGVGDTTDRASWSNVLNEVTAFAAGGNHSLAIKSDGTLWGTGINSFGMPTASNTWIRIKDKPNKVTDVVASQNVYYDKTTVSWTLDPDAENYDIYRSATSGSQGSTIATNITTASYSDATVSSSTHYFYTIVAKNSAGIAPASAQAEGWAKVLASTTGVTATQGSVYGKSTVSWTANPDAATYDIYRSTTSGTQGSVIVSNVTATSYDDTTVTAGTHYFYTVAAKNAGASSPSSSQAEGWGATLATVINVNATQGTLFGGTKISFTYNPNASGYDIYRSTTAGSQGSVIGAVCGGNTVACQTYNDTTVSASTHYFYTVVAKNGSGGTSPPSNQVEGWGKVFAATTGVTATQGTVYSKSTVSWVANPDAVNYDLYRSTASGSQGSIVATNLATTTYDDTTVVDSTHYYYTVVAKNGTDSAPASSQAQGWGKVLGAITGLSATQGTQTGKIILSWTADAGASDYEVWRSATAGGTATKITTVTAPTATFDDTTITGVASYFYTVKMKAGALVSPSSNEVEGWANAAPTSASVSLTAGSLTASPATSSNITDPNVTAGKTETFTLSITQQPSAGTVTLVGNKFVYTPPGDGAFSGSLTFQFTAIDKGGESVTGTGSIEVTCGSPTVDTFTLSATNLLVATPIQGNGTFSLPACSSNGRVKMDVLDGNDTIVSAGPIITVSNGTGLSRSFTGKGMTTPGNYTARLTVLNDSGQASKTVNLTIKAINLPSLSVSPGLTVTVGEETVTAVLTNPSTINCPLVSDSATAIADTSKCYVAFISPPDGMTVDTSGALPQLSGVLNNSGSFPITAEIYKYDGFDLQKVGTVSKTIVSSCVAPSVSSLTVQPNLLAYDPPHYGITYKAFACNGPLTGSMDIKKSGTVVDSKTLSSLAYGGTVDLSAAGVGLEEGSYVATVTITGANGTGTKSTAFSVKTAPMPTLNVSPSSANQTEDRVAVWLVPATDTSCPLTTEQAVAESDSKRCFVELKATVPGLSASVDANGLPALSGYPTEAGSYTLQAMVSRWVNGTRYDSQLTRSLDVKAVVPPVFSWKGKTTVYQGIEQLSVLLAQTGGSICPLFTDESKAIAAASGNSQRACLASFSGTGINGLTSKLSLNQLTLSGTLASTGSYPLSYSIKRVFGDGSKADIQSGDLTLTVVPIEPPQVILKGGIKVSDNTYYVLKDTAMTTINAKTGALSFAKMTLTIDDGIDITTRTGVRDGYYPLAVKALGLLERRQVKFRLAWSDFPTVYNEQTLTAIGGPSKNLKTLITDAPLTVADNEKAIIKVKLGEYAGKDLVYDAAKMGTWRARINLQTNTQSVSAPATAWVNLDNQGNGEFEVDPSGFIYLKVTAAAEIISNVAGLNAGLTSSARYIEVVKGTPIQGVISVSKLDNPAPSTFKLNLTITRDNQAALKELSWEESADNGMTWSVIPKSNVMTLGYQLLEPGKRLIRVKMINKNNLVESYTESVQLWAYSKLTTAIIGANYVAPNYPLTLSTESFLNDTQVDDAVIEWTVKSNSGVANYTGATLTLNEPDAGNVYVQVRSRPSNTRADDPNAWSSASKTVYVKTPGKPRVSINGPKDLETGKPYHFAGTVSPSWGYLDSVHKITSEFELPDGTIVAGSELDWIPTEAVMTDKKPLLFRAWVEGFKEDTLSEVTLSYSPWTYSWPTFSISLKQSLVKAPANFYLTANYDQRSMYGRFENLKYEWIFPDHVTGSQNALTPNVASGTIVFEGEYAVTLKISDDRGHLTTLTQQLSAEKADPFVVDFKFYKSNTYERSPMTLTVKSGVSGGHPLDYVDNIEWKVDGQSVEQYNNMPYLVTGITSPGEHIITFGMTSKMGETLEKQLPLSLMANQRPVCQLSTRSAYMGIYVDGKCTDSDGKITGFNWIVDGQASANKYSSSIRLFTGSEAKSSAITLTATDDAGEQSDPASITANY